MKPATVRRLIHRVPQADQIREVAGLLFFHDVAAFLPTGGLILATICY